jgi:5-(carboxyamino)imidazole ribonucleotide synthase
MLIQSGIDFNIPFSVLDPDAHAPCSKLVEFHHGKLTDFDTVMKFGHSVTSSQSKLKMSTRLR